MDDKLKANQVRYQAGSFVRSAACSRLLCAGQSVIQPVVAAHTLRNRNFSSHKKREKDTVKLLSRKRYS